MKDALQMILEGFESEPRRAWDEIIPVVIICGLLLSFCIWYAVPVPTEAPCYTEIATPRLDDLTRMALR